MQVKQPGLEMSTVQSELDLSYMQRYQGVPIPEAYERLILDTYDSCPLAIFFQQKYFSATLVVRVHKDA
jgi:glucose-6-phosphate 1-dehydrogenase